MVSRPGSGSSAPLPTSLLDPPKGFPSHNDPLLQQGTVGDTLIEQLGVRDILHDPDVWGVTTEAPGGASVTRVSVPHSEFGFPSDVSVCGGVASP